VQAATNILCSLCLQREKYNFNNLLL